LIEDIGITLGQAIRNALGDKKNIARYGNFLMPMDEALSYVAVDISNRPYLKYEMEFKPNYKKEEFDYDLIQDFFQALSMHSAITLHVSLKHGRNNHHIAESLFKGFGKSLSAAVRVQKSGRTKIPSTKGKL
jgi:imidazoleglycerol-phosphate dehydratase